MQQTKDLEVTINGPLTISGAGNYLILDPERGELYTWSSVGPGYPEITWYGRAKSWNLPAGYDPSGLSAWVEGNLDLFARLAACYQGAEWDGSNHKGRWEDAEEFDEEINNYLTSGYDEGWLPVFWDAGDYMHGDIEVCVESCLRHETIKAYSEAEVASAKRQGVILKAEDVARVMRRRLEQEADELAADMETQDPEDRDEDDAQKLAQIRALLGA